ncbi:MAG: hypothetical protein JWQ30_2615 [Sediminibacterium sp.]|nr:hypothetical protein [Sediminibacterium sp.]
MKKILFTSLFFTIVLTSIGQNSLKGYRSVFLYKISNINITIANDFMIDSAIRTSSSYISYPFTKRSFSVHGNPLKMIISETEPFAKNLDFGDVINDTTEKDKQLMSLKNTQVKVMLNGKLETDWKDLSSLSVDKYSIGIVLPLKPGGKYYTVFLKILGINDTVDVMFRNKQTMQEIIYFHFKQLGRPIAPFLAMWTQDSSSTRTIAAFMEQELAKKRFYMESVGTINTYRPEKYGRTLNNEKLYENAKLALYFGRPSADYPDSSMEYQFTGEKDPDTTTWHKTGHQLFITDLRAGNHYTLRIRYINFPENVQKHTFYVEPKWYQTSSGRIILAISMIALLLGIWLIQYQRRIKKTKEKIVRQGLEMRSLRSQLNPHFIFNALSSIQGLINKNDIPAANHYLTEFSRLLRESLVTNDKELLPLHTELKTLETYLILEQLRFHFQYKIMVDDVLDKNIIEIPSLLLQPVIENGIKHGVAVLDEKGLLTIRLQAVNKSLVVTISDNGNGFDQKIVSKGFGLKLTRERIELLNKTLKDQPIELNIESTETKGTTVHLIFKNWL